MRLLALLIIGLSLERMTVFAVDRYPKPHGKEFFTVPATQMIWGDSTNFLRGYFTQSNIFTSLKFGVRSTNCVIEFSGNARKINKPIRVYLKSVLGKPLWAYSSNQVISDIVNFIYCRAWKIA